MYGFMAENKDLLLEEKGGMSNYSRINEEGLSPSSNHDLNDKKCGFNRKALLLFFGVTAVAVAVLISAVILTVYSGKSLLPERKILENLVVPSTKTYLSFKERPSLKQNESICL